MAWIRECASMQAIGCIPTIWLIADYRIPDVKRKASKQSNSSIEVLVFLCTYHIYWFLKIGTRNIGVILGTREQSSQIALVINYIRIVGIFDSIFDLC